MKIAHININGLGNKLLSVKHLLQSFQIDILCLSEIKTKSAINLEGFKFFRFDNPVHNKGGVGILVKSHIDILNFSKSRDDNVESIWIDVKNRNSFIRIVCCYCPPGIPLTNKAFNNFYIKNRLILCGDFNSKHTELGNSASKVASNSIARDSGIALVNIIAASDLLLLSKGEPTHTHFDGSSDQLDLFFCSDKLINKTSEVEVLPDLTGSDHLPIMIKLDLLLSQPAYPELRLNYKKAKWDKFYSLVDDKVIALEQFVDDAHFDDVFDEIDCLATGLTDAINHGKLGAIPLCPANEVRSTPINPELLNAIQTRRELRRIFMLTGDKIDKANYNRATKIVHRLSHKATTDNLKDECTSLNHHIFSNSRVFWRKVHSVMSNCNATSAVANYPLVDKNKQIIIDNQIKADLFASHLEKTFTIADGPEFDNQFRRGIEYVLKSFANILTPSRDRNRVVDPMCILTFDDVYNCIMNLFNKAPGHDNITNVLIRHCPPSYIACLTRLFNLILKHGYIPKIWKFAIIVMIEKEGKDLSLPSSYRPISLLPTQPKILERIMALRLLLKMEELHIIPDYQSAFQNFKNTNDHLFRLSQDATMAKKRGEETVVCCLDNQGAFDCAWPDAIRFRMIENKLPNDFIRYASNFLDHRSFSVRISGNFSSVRTALAGVPQGSSLSPHLYNLLVCNIFRNKGVIIEVRKGHFADDIAVWASDKFRKRAVDRVNQALEQVSLWMSRWRQRLNPTKSQAMIFTAKGFPSKEKNVLKIREVVLEYRESVLYLGVHFDRLLTWKPQFEHITSRFDDRMRLLRKLCHRNFGISPHVALIIYKCFIRPVIEYGCPAFLLLQKNHIDKLQVMQNQALRLALRAPRDTPLEELHKAANIHFLKTHLVIRASNFLQSAIANNTLSGRDALEYLNDFTEEELENTPLGLMRNLLA